MHDLGQVVRELQHSRNGVTVITEDGSVYDANYVILSVSIGVLQSDLISFSPPLPVRLIFLNILFYILYYMSLLLSLLKSIPRRIDALFVIRRGIYLFNLLRYLYHWYLFAFYLRNLYRSMCLLFLLWLLGP